MSIKGPNIWAWIDQDEERLEAEGGEKAAMVRAWNDFQRAQHNDFTAADLAINTAVEIARGTGERRWELLLRHWRLQLWLDGDLKRVLPEAVDLLDLATDERVRDVPQRICAYHDIVDCYADMDPVGYADDIVANSHNVLEQLPRQHQCADCARLHLITAAAAAGNAEETEAGIARFSADNSDPTWSGTQIGVARAYEWLNRWEDAERQYQQACDAAHQRQNGEHYLEGLLGLARARAGRGEVSGAIEALHEARHISKYVGETALVARQIEVEGHIAEAAGNPDAALAYFTQAARQYLDLARYRLAATLALDAVERARARNATEPEEALAIAARAVGQMPPASRDVYARLAALGQQPIPPDAEGQTTAGAPNAAEAERGALEQALATHRANGNVGGIAADLYRLGVWHAKQSAPRAAVDYFIANAVLERLLQLPMNDREDALNSLHGVQRDLPEGAVLAALTAAEAGPPPLLSDLVDIPADRWRWLVRAIAAELEGQPVVEPAPEAREGAEGFNIWLEHVASLTTLIVRFKDRADPAACARWAAILDETASDFEQQLGPNGEGRELVTLAQGLAALSRGTDLEEVMRMVPAPFNEVIEQIGELAQHPIWQHPGMWPLDYLVEDTSQRAVRSLRMHDAHRADRLANLAFRFHLMALDPAERESLRPIAQYLTALEQLVLAGGERLPEVDPPLEEPFDAVLAAVYAAGQVSETTEQ